MTVIENTKILTKSWSFVEDLSDLSASSDKGIFVSPLHLEHEKRIVIITKKHIESLQVAKSVFSEASACLQNAGELLGQEFLAVVEHLLNIKGRIIVSGIGKSALIGQKISATLNSTGSHSVFLHAADAMHGDLGAIAPSDTLICLSRSGESPEIKSLVGVVRGFGNPIVAICASSESFLAKAADHLLLTPVPKEADPNNLAPTTSTSVQLAMGDALALALQVARGFEARDFARIHPGGSLGKRLTMTVGQFVSDQAAPAVQAGDPMDKVIIEMTSKRKGAVAVLSGEKIVGVITDGDLRRHMNQLSTLKDVQAESIMTKNPSRISSSSPAVAALDIMRNKKISQLLVTEHEHYLGLVHLHDLLEEGLA